jgi:hypothetical protein
VDVCQETMTDVGDVFWEYGPIITTGEARHQGTPETRRIPRTIPMFTRVLFIEYPVSYYLFTYREE